MDLGIAGKKALVMSSSRGIGLGISEALAAEGCDVLLTARDGDRLATAAEAINARDGGPRPLIVSTSRQHRLFLGPSASRSIRRKSV